MKYKLTVAGFLIIVMITSGLFAANSTLAVATITVTTTTDSINADDQCSLREAILSSNADSAVGGCLAGSGSDIIQFDASLPQPAIFTLTLTGAGEDNAATGDLDITSVITIEGTGPNQIVVDGNAADRAFDVLLGANLTLSGLTVRNGNPGAGAEGSGIRSAGRLTFSNGVATLNQGNGITNDGGLAVLANVNVTNNQGYGIYNFKLGFLTYTGGEVSGNQKGGIYNTVATATLTGISVLNNTGSGGIANVGSATSRLTVMNSLVKGNLSSTNGGGIRSDGAQNIADIRNTTISSNQAASAGGGVFNFGIMALIGNTIENNNARTGGGVDHFGGQISMSNDTVTHNASSDNGGGLYNRDFATLVNVTFSGNTANGEGNGGNLFNDTASISIKNTILANSDTDGNCFNSEGFMNSLGNNLDSGNTCGFTASGDLVDTNPMLGPLQDNGGTTFTLALLAGSPAINAGTNTGCPRTDQRGVARPQGSICDIGAFELEFLSAQVQVNIAGNNVGNYTIPRYGSVRPGYAGVDSGPVQVISTTGMLIVAGLREFFIQNTLATSSFQMMGLPAPQLSDTYLFSSYNNVTLNEQIRFGNVDAVDTIVTVTIGGNVMGTYPLTPNQQVRVNYAGLDTGPVEVKSSGGAKIIAAIRDAWIENGAVESFSQLMGLPAAQLSDTYWFPSYNNITLNEQLRFANLGIADTTVTVTIGGNVMGSYLLQPNEQFRVNYAGIDSGPVKVESSGNVPIIAAIREAWTQNGSTQSWIQLMGLPAPQLSDTYYFPAYDNVTLNGQLRFGNVDATDTTVTITIGGVFMGSYLLHPNEQARVSYAGVNGGPVKVQGTGGVKIIAALRDALIMNSVVESFAQMMGLPGSQLSDTYWLPAYNNVTLSEQLRIGAP